MNENRVGTLLRDWRQRRRLSQLDLALEAGVSTRHLSFVETGRSRPSPEMVLHLAEQLQVPLRERNQLLLAAGYAPQYDGALARRPGARAGPRRARSRARRPRAVSGDRGRPQAGTWSPPTARSAAARRRLARAAAAAGQLHAARVASRRIAPRILNLGEWRAHLLHRLERQIAADRRRGRGGSARSSSATRPGSEHGADARRDHGAAAPRDRRRRELSFFSTVTTFGTAVDITVSELSIEAFFPADSSTAERLGALAAVS